MTGYAKRGIEGLDAGAVYGDCWTELERHQLRRDSGVPTVSVIAGATPAAVSVWRKWSMERGRPLVIAGQFEKKQVFLLWLKRALEVRDLEEATLAWLGEAVGRGAGELEESLAGKSKHERNLMLQPLIEQIPDRDAARLCQWIVERPREELADAERLANALTVLFPSRTDPALTGLAVMNRMLTADTAPTLLVVSPEDVGCRGAWVDSAAETLTMIAQEAPGLPVGLALAAGEFSQYIESAEESRRVAMLRETVLRLDWLEAAAIRRHIEQSLGGAAGQMEDSIRRLVRDGSSGQLTRGFVEAACALLAGKTVAGLRFKERLPNADLAERSGEAACNALRDGQPLSERDSDAPEARADDAARSAAERFLYERLESLPETRGLFELNGKLTAEFGPTGEAEVDLLARQPGLAIEIDGYYHFQDPDRYRRDRRKDVALQKQGYLVLRVLAEDVVVQLGATLDAILDAVAYRRGGINARRRS